MRNSSFLTSSYQRRKILNNAAFFDIFRITYDISVFYILFFQMGGMQLQATVADQETLQAAHENPADYPDLMIRIGGFSTCFASLDKNLREDILKRTEHAL